MTGNQHTGACMSTIVLCLAFYGTASLSTVTNGILNGRLLEININLFSLFLILPQDTGIVTAVGFLFIL